MMVELFGEVTHYLCSVSYVIDYSFMISMIMSL